MITLAKAPPGGLNFGSHGRPRYTRIRVIMRRVIRRADYRTLSTNMQLSGIAITKIGIELPSRGIWHRSRNGSGIAFELAELEFNCKNGIDPRSGMYH